ncbi:tyrosine kinase receptor Cad96Ca-like [Brevipalpus obovatus]|uniref:tyrosine kinase receptor Cad96Ca-like n=1 Tax=Brevipalpus obovatus TaxID=246614 RepID=UPI003D9FA35D
MMELRIFLLIFLCSNFGSSVGAIFPSLNTPPLFDFQREWIIPEDESIGKRISWVRVQDEENDPIEFNISSNRYRDGSKYFSINSTTGEVILRKSIKGLAGRDLYIMITADDGHNKAKIEVRIRIVSSVPSANRARGNINNNQKSIESSIQLNETSNGLLVETIKPKPQDVVGQPNKFPGNIFLPINNLPSFENKTFTFPEIENGQHNGIVSESEAARFRSVPASSPTFNPFPGILWAILICLSIIISTIAIYIAQSRRIIPKINSSLSNKLSSNSNGSSLWSTAKLSINKSESSGTRESSLSFGSEYDHGFMSSSSWSDYEKPLSVQNNGPSFHANDCTAPNLSSNDPWEHPRHMIRILGILGEGCFGRVWKCEAYDIGANSGASIVAIKAVKEGVSSKEKESLINELAIMKRLKPHPNVVSLLGCCTEKEPQTLILEYVPFGTLQSYLRNARDRESNPGNPNLAELTARDLTMFAYQIAKGMAHISSEGVIHRDLAARNVLMSSNKVCKIADFGFSRTVTGDSDYESRSEGRLPIRWMAPESLKDSIWTLKSDVWSFGVLFWEIVTLGSTPYPGMDTKEVMRKVLEGHRLEKPEYCRRELYNIMFYCWEAIANQRPQFDDLVNFLDKLISSETDYIELDRFPDHSYYNIIDRMPGEKL